MSSYQKLDNDPTEYSEKVTEVIQDLQQRSMITVIVAEYLLPRMQLLATSIPCPKSIKLEIPGD